MQLRILGPLEVSGNDGALRLGGQKQRAVLALLVLNAGRVVSTDRLIAAVWGESPTPTAPTSLQNVVVALRRLLGAETLVTRPPGYMLAVDPEQVDANRFERLRREALQLPPEQRARALRAALELWRGEALADFRYEAWAESDAARLDELRLTTIEDLHDAELDAGGDANLVGDLEALVARHPRRERTLGQLMLALHRSGRQADALEAFQRLRRELAENAGLPPGESLRKLQGEILRGEIPRGRNGAREPAAEYFAETVKAMLAGRLVVVLGSDVGELAAQLASRFSYPGDATELTRVSQYIAVMQGSGPLWDELHALVGAAQPTPVHRFFARLPQRLRARGAQHQLLVTTSYDLALEQALLDEGEEFDVVSYIASGPHRGRFCHFAPDGSAAAIEIPNTYASELSLERRTIILKLHGGFDPSPQREWESYVVTEDDYIEYLAHSDVSASVPVGLAARLQRSHFLFLGYTMADWNLRVVLKRLWGDNPLTWRSWAVEPDAKVLEREFWRRLGVDVLEAPLDEYVERLGRHLEAEGQP